MERKAKIMFVIVWHSVKNGVSYTMESELHQTYSAAEHMAHRMLDVGDVDPCCTYYMIEKRYCLQ